MNPNLHTDAGDRLDDLLSGMTTPATVRAPRSLETNVMATVRASDGLWREALRHFVADGWLLWSVLVFLGLSAFWLSGLPVEWTGSVSARLGILASTATPALLLAFGALPVLLVGIGMIACLLRASES